MTAPAVPWRSNPGIRVTLAGQQLSGAVTAITADTAGRVLIDAATVHWGTADPLSQPDPATGSLVLLDRSLTWAARADLMRAPVTCEWLPDAPMVAEGATAWTYFRGRVTGVQIAAPEVHRDRAGNRFTASRVELALTSVEADLGNRFVTDGSAWPRETIGARATRIAALAGTTVTVRDYWATPDAAAVPADQLAGKSARDLLLQLYNSTGGDRMVYVPHTSSYEWLGRRRYAQRGLAALRSTTLYGRAGQGTYATASRYATNATGPTTSPVQNGTYLDGQYLTGADRLSKTTGQRITRSQLTWANLDTNTTGTSVVVDNTVDEAVLGRAAITLDSLHVGGAAAGNSGYPLLNAQDLLALATQEGSLWQPPALTWDTELSGGFHMPQQVQLSLRGHATAWRVFVNRSWFAPLGIRPIFSATGGTITYTGGRWVIGYALAGWASVAADLNTPVKQHPLSWDEMDPDGPVGTLVWTDGPDPNGLHESLTYEDLGFIGQGNTTTAEGPDTGWDEYQT